MLRRVLASASLALLVVGATACNPGRPPAATVEGADIDSAHVDALLEAFVEVDPDTYGPELLGVGQDTFVMERASSLLNSLVFQVFQAELAADRGVEADEAQRTEAEGLVKNSFVAGADAEPDPNDPTSQATIAEAQETSAAIYEALPEETQDWLVDLRAGTLALAEDAAADASQSTDGGEPSETDSICLRAIVVDEADVETVQQRLESGEDFGQVSTEVTIDPQLAEAGGELGECLTPDAYLSGGLIPEVVELVRLLPAGEVTEPFDLGEGAVALFEVSDRQPNEDPEAALRTLVEEELVDADITVDPRFGTWDPATATITPPEGARDATPPVVDPETLDPAAAPAG